MIKTTGLSDSHVENLKAQNLVNQMYLDLIEAKLNTAVKSLD